MHLFLSVNVDVLETLERGHRNEGAEGVELVRAVLILIATTAETNTDAEGHTPIIKNAIMITIVCILKP